MFFWKLLKKEIKNFKGGILMTAKIFTFLAAITVTFQGLLANVMPKMETFEYCQFSNSSCELKWELTGNDGNSQSNIHIFTADNWLDLMPLSSPEIFLASTQSSKTYRLTTKQTSVCIPGEPLYVRLIIEQEGKRTDLARLIHLEGQHANQPICKGAYSSSIKESVWRQVGPYLLPEKNTIRKFLDKICNEIRIVSSEEALIQAGFEVIYHQDKLGLVVAKHPNLPGYLLKLYLDSSPRAEWSLWVLRAHGARVIQNILNKNHFNCFMKVPKKWIYPIPQKGRPAPAEKLFPKDFILVVEDMNILSKKISQNYYKNGMSYPRLEALYRIIDEGGLSDSHIGNIPFSKDQKIAFIDTEYVNSWPVHFDWLTKYFSPLNQLYWLKLIRFGEDLKKYN